MNKYEKIMEHIEVTEEMKDRILNNALQHSVSKTSSSKKKISKYFDVKYMVAGIAILLIGISTLYKPEPPIVTGIYGQSNSIFSIEELSEAVEFGIKNIKSLEEKSGSIDYILISDNIAEIEYIVDNNSYIYHISKNAYEEYTIPIITETISIEDIDIKISGEHDKVSFAIWEKENIHYSIYATEPITKSEMIDLIKEALE